MCVCRCRLSTTGGTPSSIRLDPHTRLPVAIRPARTWATTRPAIATGSSSSASCRAASAIASRTASLSLPEPGACTASETSTPPASNAAGRAMMPASSAASFAARSPGRRATAPHADRQRRSVGPNVEPRPTTNSNHRTVTVIRNAYELGDRDLMKTFSERKGLKPVSEIIQIDSMTKELTRIIHEGS